MIRYQSFAVANYDIAKSSSDYSHLKMTVSRFSGRYPKELYTTEVRIFENFQRLTPDSELIKFAGFQSKLGDDDQQQVIITSRYTIMRRVWHVVTKLLESIVLLTLFAYLLLVATIVFSEVS